MPFVDDHGVLLDGDDVADRAAWVEQAGLDGVWMGDHLPVPDDPNRGMPDPLLCLMVAARATSRIEVGTCILNAALRSKYDLAQRLYTVQTMAPGRFTIGLGTGSRAREYEAVGLDWASRFRILRENVAAIREMFAGENPAGLTDESTSPRTWARAAGQPPLLLGAWHSRIQIERAAREYDGWLASGTPGTQFGGWRKVLSESIKIYRDAGGQRAILANVGVAIGVPTTPLTDDGRFSLECEPAEAADRLGLLAELGYDDVQLVQRLAGSSVRPQTSLGPSEHTTARGDITLEKLTEIRALLPAVVASGRPGC
jgi:alkanesulfonate monooxygenase SsuD/methylene tetrahydromethanopterin reductase-like flavin-dependent oxidoreductase (luciferase family)